MSVADLFTGYSIAGTPQTYLAYNGGIIQTPLLIFRLYMRDPILERPPTPDEMRLLCEYCAYFINAPCLNLPREPLAVLRSEIEHVKTPYELAEWLRGCRAIGLSPLGAL